MDCEHKSQHNEGVPPDIVDEKGRSWWHSDHMHCKFCKKPWDELVGETEAIKRYKQLRI